MREYRLTPAPQEESSHINGRSAEGERVEQPPLNRPSHARYGQHLLTTPAARYDRLSPLYTDLVFARTLSGTNQFEIVYHGSVEDLKNVPGGAVALIRDRQTWIAPSGKQARVYGLANGSSQIVESDDDFKAWESEHVVSSAPAAQ